MYQQPSGLLRLQSVLANRRYKSGGQLPSEVENQVKSESFGNTVGGGIGQMQRIFSGGRGADRDSTSQGEEASIVASSSSDGNGMSGIQRYQAIASRTSGGTPDSNNNFSSNAPTYAGPSSSSIPNGDNRSNLGVASELKYQPANYKEMIPYLEKWDDRNFNRNAMYSGISNLGNALGGRTGSFTTVFGSSDLR